MQLNDITKIKKTSKKRMGRGLGSGKGKTGGRGQKGQKSRGSVPASFTGGGLPLYKKLPLKRGWGNRKTTLKPTLIQLEKLNIFDANATVDIESVITKGLVSESQARSRGVKILLKGELTKALTVALPVSQKVAEKITKAGGKVV